MSNLQDKINNARNSNDELATDAINDIEKQTYYLRTDFDRLTIDKSTRESRRQAALKILEKVRNGEIEKVDEDDIYQMHHENDSINDELKDNHQENKDLTSYKTKENNHSDSEKIKIEQEQEQEQEQEIEFEDLNAIDRLKVISQLVNNSSETVNQDQNNDNEHLNESEDEDEDKKNSNKNINEDKFDSSESISVSSNSPEENDSTYNEHNEKKPGIFKRMMNKLFGGNE